MMNKMTKTVITLMFLLVGYFNTAQANTIKIYAQAAPGGAIDLTARTLSKILTEQNIDNVVINEAGAYGDIAYNIALKNKDNTILAGAAATFIFSSVVQNRQNPYTTTMKVFAPVVKTPMVFLTSINGHANFQSLIDLARSEKLPCAISSAHGAAELARINKMYLTKFQPVTYKGSAPLALDLAGDHIRCAYDSAGTHIHRHEAKQVKILAITANVDSLMVPLIDTMLTNYTFENWYGFAIANDSILLKNEKLINSIKNFKYSSHSKTQNQPGFTLELTRDTINQEIEEQTELYRKLSQ